MSQLLIVDNVWNILESPSDLDGGVDYQIEHDDTTLWLAPDLSTGRRQRAIEVALQQILSELEPSIPGVD